MRHGSEPFCPLHFQPPVTESHVLERMASQELKLLPMSVGCGCEDGPHWERINLNSKLRNQGFLFPFHRSTIIAS